MLQWYRGQIRERGIVGATSLAWRVGWSRIQIGLRNKVLPQKLTCPCCGWKGRRFYDFIEPGYRISNAVCPQCDSHPRHRAFYLWLSCEYHLQQRRGVALVFAAEGALAPLWQSSAGLKVYRIDIEPSRGRDVLGDLTHLPIATNAVDLLWCHHVLEHVEDDRAAIKELYRVLSPDKGELIVSVPMIQGTTTEEYGFSDPMKTGHWRIYGDDFADRLAEGGFSVREIDFRLPATDLERYGISPEPFYICIKRSISRDLVN